MGPERGAEPGKDLELLDPLYSPNRTDSITERIARLQREVARGTAVYTNDELQRLHRMLDEYLDLMRGLLQG